MRDVRIITAMVIRAPLLLMIGLIVGGAAVSGLDLARTARVALASEASDAGSERSGAPDVELAAAGVGALGRVEPASRVRRIAPPSTITMNRVDNLFVNEGDDVIAGQPLAEFADAARKRAAVELADAALAEAQTELARVRAAGRPEDIDAQTQRIASLRFQQVIARSDADRADKLVPSGAGARAVAERADAAANRAAAELREAEARLASLAKPRPEDVAVAEAKVVSARAASVEARAEAALSQIVAPISGKVLRIYARPGDLVGADGLLDLADLDRLDVVADVYETDLSRVRVGARADVIVPGTSVRYPARVREVGWMVKHVLEAGTDPTAAVDGRTVEVRLSLGDEGSSNLRQRINAQVHVAIQP
jgi:HlyD family secretion protein